MMLTRIDYSLWAIIVGLVVGITISSGYSWYSSITPYIFHVDNEQTGFSLDRTTYNVVGDIEKIACSRLPLPEGFRVTVDVPGEGSADTTWSTKDVSDNRDPGTDPIFITVDLPPIFTQARITTLHACPDLETVTEDILYIPKIFYVIDGNATLKE